MKQKMIFMAMACLLLSAIATFGQAKTDFSGEWTLDVSKSKVNSIQSGTMKVTQTDQGITFTTDLKRTPPPDAQRAVQQPAPLPMTFSLDGKETSFEVPGPQGSTSTAKLKSIWDGTKLNLSSTRTFNTPNGEMTVTSKDTWELVDGGKALRITRETESPRGKQSAEFYYVKK
jgi:hypothetical protein